MKKDLEDIDRVYSNFSLSLSPRSTIRSSDGRNYERKKKKKNKKRKEKGKLSLKEGKDTRCVRWRGGDQRRLDGRN